ncbi:MAG TPA: hypothetical protein VGK66_03655 [Solirubrobacterales bacterium]|nr:hypothetical protein [Solirubrobacterales bacterium]
MEVRYLTVFAAFLVVVVAIAAAGCGSGSDSGSGEDFAETRLPMAAYAHKTDLICGEGSVEQGELAGAYLEKHPHTKEVDLVIPAAVPPIEKEITELHELGLPKGHEEEAEVFVGEMEAALEALKEEPKGALSQKDNPFNKTNELGEKLGLGDCSRNP